MALNISLDSVDTICTPAFEVEIEETSGSGLVGFVRRHMLQIPNVRQAKAMAATRLKYADNERQSSH